MNEIIHLVAIAAVDGDEDQNVNDKVFKEVIKLFIADDLLNLDGIFVSNRVYFNSVVDIGPFVVYPHYPY